MHLEEKNRTLKWNYFHFSVFIHSFSLLGGWNLEWNRAWQGLGTRYKTSVSVSVCHAGTSVCLKYVQAFCSAIKTPQMLVSRFIDCYQWGWAISYPEWGLEVRHCLEVDIWGVRWSQFCALPKIPHPHISFQILGCALLQMQCEVRVWVHLLFLMCWLNMAHAVIWFHTNPKVLVLIASSSLLFKMARDE